MKPYIREVIIPIVAVIIIVFLALLLVNNAFGQVSKKTIRHAEQKALESKTKYQLALISHVVNGLLIASVDSTTLADYEIQAVNDSLFLEGLRAIRHDQKIWVKKK